SRLRVRLPIRGRTRQYVERFVFRRPGDPGDAFRRGAPRLGEDREVIHAVDANLPLAIGEHIAGEHDGGAGQRRSNGANPDFWSGRNHWSIIPPPAWRRRATPP